MIGYLSGKKMLNHKKIAESFKKATKEPQIRTLLLLIALSGLFCLRSFFFSPGLYAQASQLADDSWITVSITGSDKISLTQNAKKRQEVLRRFSEYYLPEKEQENIVSDFEYEIRNLVDNYPIREMAPFISKFDRQVAGLVVGIAKKESDWGKHAPSKNGETCYNYWGYKSSGSRGTAMGYACFGSPEEAVKTVGGRIKHFVNKDLNTPSKMVVWKCGSSCSWDNPKNVAKWISDVSVYYNQIAYK